MLSETWKATLEITSRKTLSDFRALRDLARFITTFRQFQKNSLKSSKIQVKKENFKKNNSERISTTCQNKWRNFELSICEKENSRKSAKRKQKRTFFSDSQRFSNFIKKRNLESGAITCPKKRERAKVTQPELKKKGQKRCANLNCTCAKLSVSSSKKFSKFSKI